MGDCRPNCFTPLRPPSHMMVMDMAVAEFDHTLSQLLQVSWTYRCCSIDVRRTLPKKHGPVSVRSVRSMRMRLIYLFVAGQQWGIWVWVNIRVLQSKHGTWVVPKYSKGLTWTNIYYNMGPWALRICFYRLISPWLSILWSSIPMFGRLIALWLLSFR